VSRLRLALEIEPVNNFRLQPVYKSGYRLLHLYDDGKGRGEDRVESAAAQIAA
jgi:hypothetical protein